MPEDDPGDVGEVGDEERDRRVDVVPAQVVVRGAQGERGLIEVGFLGGAQIDRYGNINTTVIGAYDNPKVRLPGSGGACEIAINAKRIFMIMRLKRRAFVDKLDFVTSPGHQVGSARTIPGGGPALVVTDKALFDFGGPHCNMRLLELYPGVAIDEVRAEVGWPLAVADAVAATPAPTVEELHLLREQLDPQGIYRS